MTEPQDPAVLAERLAALERRVAELEGRAAVPTPRRPAPPAPGAVRISSNRPGVPPVRVPSHWSGEHWLERGEGWLGRVGVGLVVVGLIFLFRYAVDQGWLTPAMRILIGLLIGGALLFAGLRRFPERRAFRQILMGGGVVILFITGLAASELYALVSGPVALGFHALVAAIAFGIARRQRDPVMASIGASGALLPPGFLLEGSVAGGVLWLYLLIMVLWTGLLIATSGWPSFVLVAAASGVLATFHLVPGGGGTQIAAVLVIAAAWLCYAVLPLVRVRLPLLASAAAPALPDPARLVVPITVTVALATALSGFVLAEPRAFEVFCALAALGFAALAWRLRGDRAAVMPPAPLLRSSLAALRIDDFEIAVLASTISLGAAALAAFELPGRSLALALVAAAAVHAAPRLRIPLLAWVGHLFFGYIALEFLAGIERLSARGPFDAFALALGAALALAASCWTALRETEERAGYFAAIYVGAHVLLATELSDVPGAAWLASASYALVGSGLVLLGLRRPSLALQRAGMLSLALLVLRLFTFDLARAGVGVRIVLFLFCGFAFLALSHRFRAGRQPAAR